jgi:hypothetical protein
MTTVRIRTNQNRRMCTNLNNYMSVFVFPVTKVKQQATVRLTMAPPKHGSSQRSGMLCPIVESAIATLHRNLLK